jgi:surface antigen
MLRILFLAVPLVLAPMAVSVPAAAASASSAQSRTGETCDEQRQTRRNRGRGFGRAVGGIAGAFGGRLGGAARTVTNFLPVSELLGEAIAAMLDCDEQQKAAGATEEAVRGGVGTTTTWSSETRPGVTGSSTVTAAERTAGGDECMTVTDIVIVDGEETRAPKRMCRRPPNNRYVRV